MPTANSQSKNILYFKKLYNVFFYVDSTSERLAWVDYAKTICMLMVILSHTFNYYTFDSNLFLRLMQPTRLLVFFFISGYLIKIESFNFKKMMSSIAKKLLFPYLIFTSIIWIPKHLVRGGLSLSNALIDIFGGYASWFVAALVVSKICLAIILYFTKSLRVIWIWCTILAFAGLAIRQYIPGEIPWYAHNGMLALIYLAAGMTYRKYEFLFNKNLVLQAIISVLIYFLCVSLDYFIFKESTYIFELNYDSVSLRGVLSFMFLSTLGIWMMISIVKLLPSGIKWMTYIGKNSLTYYYLNTGVLTVLIIIMYRFGMGYNGNDYITVLLFLLTVIILTFISKLIINYAPWMLGDFKKK